MKFKNANQRKAVMAKIKNKITKYQIKNHEQNQEEMKRSYESELNMLRALRDSMPDYESKEGVRKQINDLRRRERVRRLEAQRYGASLKRTIERV